MFLVFTILMHGESLFSQNEINPCEEKTQKVFETLILNIGNSFPSPPNLTFSDNERSVASISKGNIIIERKALDILCSFYDSESAIAYVLAHELAHHYLNHSWMNKTGLSDADIETLLRVIKERAEVEQAIVYGSRAMGTFKKGSDIDIALKGKDLTRSICSHIYFELEETALPYFFDITYYAGITNTKLVEHIDRVGKLLYSVDEKV